MRDELQRQIRHTLESVDESASPHDLPTSAQVWSRLQFRLAYRPPTNRYTSQAGTLLAALYVLAFLMWFTWTGCSSAGLLAVLGFAACAAVYLLLHVSRSFRS
jgi:hypothetical protein